MEKFKSSWIDKEAILNSKKEIIWVKWHESFIKSDEIIKSYAIMRELYKSSWINLWKILEKIGFTKDEYWRYHQVLHDIDVKFLFNKNQLLSFGYSSINEQNIDIFSLQLWIEYNNINSSTDELDSCIEILTSTISSLDRIIDILLQINKAILQDKKDNKIQILKKNL